MCSTWLLSHWALSWSTLRCCCPTVQQNETCRGERLLGQAVTVWHCLRGCPQAGGLWCLGEHWQGSPAVLCFRPFCFGRLKGMMDVLPVWILKGLTNVTGLLPFLTLYFWHEKGRWKMWGAFLLNFQDFCLMWLIINISDRNGIKIWNHGSREGVLDQVGSGCAAGTILIPLGEGRKIYMEWQDGITPQNRNPAAAEAS